MYSYAFNLCGLMKRMLFTTNIFRMLAVQSYRELCEKVKIKAVPITSLTQLFSAKTRDFHLLQINKIALDLDELRYLDHLFPPSDRKPFIPHKIDCFDVTLNQAEGFIDEKIALVKRIAPRLLTVQIDPKLAYRFSQLQGANIKELAIRCDDNELVDAGAAAVQNKNI